MSAPGWSAATEALARASAVEVVTAGRRTGREHRVTVWFAYHEGAVFFLAHARAHGRGTDWYRNLMAASGATLLCAGLRIRVVPVPFPSGVEPHRYTVALFEAKYGVGAVDTWYDPALRIPLRTVPAS